MRRHVREGQETNNAIAGQKVSSIFFVSGKKEHPLFLAMPKQLLQERPRKNRVANVLDLLNLHRAILASNKRLYGSLAIQQVDFNF